MGGSPVGLNRFQLSPAALRDLDSIWHYIASDSIPNADKVEQAILQTCLMAAENADWAIEEPMYEIPKSCSSR